MPTKALLQNKPPSRPFEPLALNNLKNLRKEKKLTLEKLAELSQLSPSYLSRLEMGTRRFNTDILQKLSTILHCHPSDLIEGKKTVPSSGIKDLPIYRTQTNMQGVDFRKPINHIVRPEALIGINTAFGIYIDDTSYSPKYMSGDTLFIHTERPIAQGCSIFAITTTDSIRIGQFEEWANSTLLLREFSQDRKLLTIPHTSLRVVYRIIGSIEIA